MQYDQRRCRKVDNFSSGESFIAFEESTKLVGGLSESTFLCRADLFLGRKRLDFEYCQII